MKEYSVITWPGFFRMKSWQARFQWVFKGPNTPLSRGWRRCVVFGGRQKRMTLSLAASSIDPGWKWEECPSKRSSKGRTAGACSKKWNLNQSWKISESIHPRPPRPYIVPGTSPSIRAPFNVFLRKITRGGIALPAALVHAITVICFLLPVVTVRGCFCPFSATTFIGLWSRGSPVSSQFHIWAGESKRWYSSMVWYNKSK